MNTSRDLTVRKVWVLPIFFCRFGAVPLKIPEDFFFFFQLNWNWRACSKIETWKIAKAILGKQSKVSGLPYFKNYCKATVIKTLWYCCQLRHIHQWDRIKSPEIEHTCMVNWFSTKDLSLFNRDGTVFFTKWCWNNVIALCQRKKKSWPSPHTVYKSLTGPKNGNLKTSWRKQRRKP